MFCPKILIPDLTKICWSLYHDLVIRDLEAEIPDTYTLVSLLPTRYKRKLISSWFEMTNLFYRFFKGMITVSDADPHPNNHWNENCWAALYWVAIFKVVQWFESVAKLLKWKLVVLLIIRFTKRL